MVAISLPPPSHKWGTVSFVSTLYLQPILDCLLEKVPQSWHAEVRLGLQEALVNAAKHGNSLDPAKHVSVRFAIHGSSYWWVITDQGSGFTHPYSCHDTYDGDCIFNANDCGRGLYILYQVFDQVHWNQGGREVHLCKKIYRARRQPLIF